MALGLALPMNVMTALLSPVKGAPSRTIAPNEERDLLSAARGGNTDAFGRLVEIHRDSIIRLAYGYVRDREEALDIAQEAFIKAYRHLGRFRGESAFSTWLYRITCNLCRDRLRQRARRQVGSLEDMMQSDGQVPIATSTEDPREHAEQQEMETLILHAINRLPPKQRDVILLREIAELSYAEIAAAVGCRLGTVMSRLFHARQAVAQALEPLVHNQEA
jgi:RNA polymerase sigma-70 factor (ECF subfamily)